MPLLFKIIHKCWQDASNYDDTEVDFYLEENDCEVNDTDSLKIWLSKRVSNIEHRYGKNDWRSALLRGILAYSGLDTSIINANRDMMPLTNTEGI